MSSSPTGLLADWSVSQPRHGRSDHPAALPSPVHRRWPTCPFEAVLPRAELANASRDPDFFAHRAILAIRNDQLPPVNDMLMHHLPRGAADLLFRGYRLQRRR
jgi:hypothetical protein